MRGSRPERALADAIVRDGIVRSGERVSIACSGGPDSVALAWAMADAAHELRLQLQLVYVDHARRASSMQDECVVAAASAALELPLVVVPLAGSDRSEAQLRDARYAALERTARAFGSSAIATAHHAQDQSETVLLALFRGTGATGLAGIPARRPIAPGLDVVRPLLARDPGELLRFCHEAAAPYAVDPTNADPGYARNGVRLALAALRPLFPQLDRSIARTAAICADEAGDSPRAELRRRIRERVRVACGLEDVSYEHIESVARAIQRGASGRFHLKAGIELEVAAGEIVAIVARE